MRIKESSTKVNLILQIAYRILTVLTPLITSPYLSRILGPSNLGIYSATYAYANYYILLAMLGVEYHGNREISLHDNPQELKKTFWGIYYVQACVAVFAIIIYLLTIPLFSAERRFYLLWQGLWIVAAGLDINWFFFGTQQFKLTVTRNVVIKILTIAGMFLLVRGENDLWKYILLMACGLLVNQLVMWFFLIKQIGFSRPNGKDIVPNIGPMFKLFIPVIGLSVFQVTDKIMVDWLSDSVNGGCYYNADRLINIPISVITALSTVMLPKLVREFDGQVKDKEKAFALLGKSSELTISLTAAIAFGLGAISFEFVPFFFGKGYELCVSLILGFVPVIIFKAQEEFVRSQYLIPTKQDNIYIQAVFVAAVINIIANYFLILHFGAFGAVLGTIIAESVLFTYQLIRTRGEISFFKIFMRNWPYLLFGLVMFVVVRVIAATTNLSDGLTVVISICSGACLYCLLSLVYALLNKKSVYHNYVTLMIYRKK